TASPISFQYLCRVGIACVMLWSLSVPLFNVAVGRDSRNADSFGSFSSLRSSSERGASSNNAPSIGAPTAPPVKDMTEAVFLKKLLRVCKMSGGIEGVLGVSTISISQASALSAHRH